MLIKDTKRLDGFNTPKMPQFKGHVKITLHNCKNGKNEVIEGENIVTNAVRDILAANYLGAVDYSKIFGSDGLWKKWYGGVLCYQNPHPTITVDNEEVLDPDNYYPADNTTNPLIAHAGQTTIDPNHDDDLRRGNPTTAAYVYTENSVKQVWEWGTTHGNGTISALSLTHADTGDVGLGSNHYAFSQFVPFEKISMAAFDTVSGGAGQLMTTETVYGRYDDTHGFCFAIGDDGEYTLDHCVFETNKVTVYIKSLPFFKTGIYGKWGVVSDFIKKFTITSSNITFFVNPCYYFDYANKRLWLFSNTTSTNAYSKTNIKYIVIDCENQTEYAHGEIVSDTATIAQLGYVRYQASTGYSRVTNTSAIIKDGNYFCFPTAQSAGIAVNGYKRINITNQSDQNSVSFSSTQSVYTQPVYGGSGRLISLGSSVVEFSGVSGIVVNGDTGYPCKTQGFTTNTFKDAFSDPYAPSFYAMGVNGNNWGVSTTQRYVAANKMLNTTLFNLPTPVQKTTSQAMTVEYTLTEVTSSS